MTARNSPRAGAQVFRLDGKPDFASVLEALHFGVLITDPSRPKNPVVYVNQAFTDLTGYSVEDCAGKQPDFLQGPETDRHAISEINYAVRSGERVRKEILTYRKDGSSFWTDLALIPTTGRDGKVIRIVGVLDDLTARKADEALRGEAEAQLASIVHNMPGFVFRRVAKPDGSSRYFTSAFGAPAQGDVFGEAAPSELALAIHTDDRTRVEQEQARDLISLKPTNTEFRIVTHNGEQAWMRTFSTPRHLENGDIVWDGVGLDITREKESENRLTNIASNIPGYLFRRVRSLDGSITFPYISSSFARLIGAPAGSIMAAEDLWAAMHPDDIELKKLAYEESARALSMLTLETRLISRSGEVFWLRSYSTPTRSATGEVVWDGVSVDITKEKQTELKLEFLANHDALTGLANRSRLNELLTTEVFLARLEGDQIALSKFLVSEFFEMNETLGPDSTDAALKGVATRMNNMSSVQGQVVSASLGGGEFAMLRRGPTAADTAQDFAENLMRELGHPMVVDATELLVVEPSIGTAVLRPGELVELSDGEAAVELMKRAAIARSLAVRSGRGAHRFYDFATDHRTDHRMLLRRSLRTAIDENQFELHYQPLVDLLSGQIVSAEALIRWNHPKFGMLRPDLFISLAEESGLIGALGDWVMRSAMRQAKSWENVGLKVPKIALNISGMQVRRLDFVSSVRKILSETGSDARNFELELTEGFMIERSPKSLSVLAELKQLGFSLVIDDFGAGHASFQYLRDFPIDKLKIDQMFVRQLIIGSNDALIIRAISSMARSLGLSVVAEGIETIEQRDFLRDEGCSTGQGYYFSKPLVTEDFAKIIRNGAALPLKPDALPLSGILNIAGAGLIERI